MPSTKLHKTPARGPRAAGGAKAKPSTVEQLARRVPPGATLQRERVNCGKPKCGRCAGGRLGHGPYWYAYWHDPKTQKTRSAYVGSDARLGEFLRGRDGTDTKTESRPGPGPMPRPTSSAFFAQHHLDAGEDEDLGEDLVDDLVVPAPALMRLARSAAERALLCFHSLWLKGDLRARPQGVPMLLAPGWVRRTRKVGSHLGCFALTPAGSAHVQRIAGRAREVGRVARSLARRPRRR